MPQWIKRVVTPLGFGVAVLILVFMLAATATDRHIEQGPDHA